MKSKTAITAAVCLAFIIALLPLYGQSKGGGDAVAAITKLENDGVKADLANDKSFIQNNTTSDFVAGLSLGVWEDKAATLKGMDDPSKNKTNSESISDLKVTSYGNVAVARYTETYDSMRDGKPLARTVLCTDTWVKQGSAWKEVASHCSQKAKE
ncbi:MAG: nuclear transport factor 2 family protein [Terriglobales bacterium]